MRLRSARCLGWRLSVAILALFGVVALGVYPAAASVPPWKIAAARQASARAEASKSGPVDVSITVLGTPIRTYLAAGAELSGSSSLTAISASKTPKGSPSKKLRIAPDAPLPWSIVSTLIASDDPLRALESTLPGLEPDTTEIATRDDAFIYIYGGTSRVALSRDLRLIRGVSATSDGIVWEFRLSGELGASGLPARIDILRGGAPYANVELALSVRK